MNKFLLTITLAVLSAPLAQSKEKAPVVERSTGGNLYQSIPRAPADPNATSRWRVSVMKPTQHYYTKSGIVSYRYAHSTGSVENLFGDYLGPRSAVFTPQNDFATTASGVRSYANVSSRIMQGVTMAPRTEVPVEKVKKSAKSAETSIQLAQQR